MYDKFTSDDEMWELGKMRESALNLEESHKMEFLDKGRDEGIEIGRTEGIEIGDLNRLISSCALIIQNLYKVECTSWLNSLSKDQLEQLQQVAFKEKDFNQLKEKIESL